MGKLIPTMRAQQLPLCDLCRAHDASRMRCRAAGTSSAAAKVHEAQTYLGEKFTKTVPEAPPGSWQQQKVEKSPIQIERLDHCAIEVSDVERSLKFYTEVLGFEKLARPDFPFGGSWLGAGGLVLHLIAKDPSVDRNVENRQDMFTKEPEQWYIRRSEHKAFQVTDLEATEEMLKRSAVEFHKFLVPGTNAAQIFLYDPDYNGIELGAAYKEIAEHLINKDK